MIGLSLRHAWLDLRASIRHLRLFSLVLILGVAVISTVGSLVASIKAGIDRDAKALLGGDIEIRQLYQPLSLAAEAFLTFNSKAISRTLDVRAMAETPERRSLVEMKGVDIFYPLFGEMIYTKKLLPEERAAAFAKFTHQNMPHEASVDQSLLDMLNIQLGGVFRIGSARFVVTAIIASEPDRGFSAMSLGPRVLVTRRAFHDTGLVAYGSMVNFRYRITLANGLTPEIFKAKMKETFPNATWNLRDWTESAPGLVSLIDRLSLFFALTGITALMVAGIGIANATSVYLWSKRHTIAALKCLGASSTHIYRMYLIQILIVAAFSILIGCMVGTFAEMALVDMLSNLLPAQAQKGIYAKPLILSALMGFIIVLLFAALPLISTRSIKPAALFRGHIENIKISLKNPLLLVGMALLTALLIGIAIIFTNATKITLFFSASAAFALLVLYALGVDLQHKSKKSAHSGRLPLTLSLALANLARPGAATKGMVIALGIGISLMVTLTLVGANLRTQIEQGLPEKAPAFFLADIQPSQLEAIQDKIRAIQGVGKVFNLPIVRGRIIKLNDKDPDSVDIADNARWGVRGERGLTESALPPENSTIIKGDWWPKDYDGPPLVSFDANLARGMGLSVGDTITIASLDKKITATIANLRDIQWGSLEMNFAIVLSPGTLKDLPTTYIATVAAPLQAEKEIQQMLADNYPSVAIVRVREVLNRVSGILEDVSSAVMISALLTVLCSILVMAGAIHASLHKRVFDTVMLKVLGATRGRILKIYLTEFAVIAVSVAVIAVIIGSAGAWGIMQLMVFSEFILMPDVVIYSIGGSLALAIALGLVATHFTLGVRPLSLLRNE